MAGLEIRIQLVSGNNRGRYRIAGRAQVAGGDIARRGASGGRRWFSYWWWFYVKLRI
jgi:hypothetical protein